MRCSPTNTDRTEGAVTQYRLTQQQYYAHIGLVHITNSVYTHLMTSAIHSVLVAVVTQANKTDGKATEQAIAESLDISPATLATHLETLCEFDLVATTDDAYRPTITAHELLEAGIELDETLVLDLVEE